MKKLLLLTALCTLFSNHLMAAESGWYLYVWSNTLNTGGDLGQFQTTDMEGVFTLQGVTVSENGVKFCVRNASWSTQYGWSKDQEGSVSSTGVDVPLGITTSASGWLALAPGKYDVTFNLKTPSIRFDMFIEPHDEYPVPDLKDDYLRGGDISMLTYVESFGAKFYTADGTGKDVIDIMKENGCNIVRLRLYNNPGTPVTYNGTTYKVPEGYLDEADVLRLARRAKEKGMRVQLTFHYSDYWTNGAIQFKPKDWQNLSFEELKNAIYDYTAVFLRKMKLQGTTPEYVSLGNEIESGFLFGDATSMDAVNGGWNKPANQAALLGKASQAVRDECPNTQIIIHYTLSENVTANRYYTLLNNLKNNGYSNYDIIGASYYPYWTNQKPTMLNALANSMYQNFSKPVMIMETGYSWTQYRPSGRNGGDYEGQLHLNGTAYNEATKEGQKTFIQELQTVIKGNSHLLGYLYWDPIMVDQKVNGKWIETAWSYRQDGTNWWQDGNVVSNTTWFDYEGKALPVLDAIKEDWQATSISNTMHDKQLPSSDSPIYNLSGQRVAVSSSRAVLPKGLYVIDGRKVVVNHP